MRMESAGQYPPLILDKGEQLTSPLEAYLRDNPQLRSMDRAQLLDQLYQTSGVEDKDAFTKQLLTDADNSLGAKAERGAKETAGKVLKGFETWYRAGAGATGRRCY